MVRKEGFINLDKINNKTKENFSILEPNLPVWLIEFIFSTSESKLLKINYNNYVHYFKYNNEVSPYNELVANELAHDFGLPALEYDLAILGNKKGVLSKSFEKDNFHYIKGEQLLYDAGYSDDFHDMNLHNLDNIWYALEYRYQNHKDKLKIVEKLMNRIVSLFIFDILLCQYDRHSNNWQIEEGTDYIDIAPVYDNEYMLSRKLNIVNLTIDDTSKSLDENLKSFLKVSSSEFVNLVKEKMWIISDENLKKVFKRIENKTGYPMKQDIKDYYLKEFSLHRNELEKIIYKEEAIIRK